MKKRQRRILAALLACVMTALPVSDVTAAVTYDAASAELSAVLFPGDSLTGIDGTVILDGGAFEPADTVWKNEDAEKVYRASAGEEGTVQLETAGYTVTVENGTVSKMDAGEDEEKKRHYVFSEEEKPETPTDLAYYAAGDTVVLTAAEPAEGMEFTGWSFDPEQVTLGEPTSAVASFTMPEKAVKVTATYGEKAPETYALTVNNGTDDYGAGVYEAGAAVQITAADRSGENLEFAGWSVDTQNASLADSTAATTTFAMPEGAVTVSAQYQEKAPETEAQYTLTVVYGTGSGAYAEGETITITADDRTGEGLVFAGWYVETQNVQPGTPDETTTELIMPAAEVTIAATYEEASATESQSGTTDGTTDAQQGGTTGETSESQQSETTDETTSESQSETTGETTSESQSETTGETTAESQSETTGETAPESQQNETTGETSESQQSETTGETAPESQQSETAGETTAESQQSETTGETTPESQQSETAGETTAESQQSETTAGTTDAQQGETTAESQQSETTAGTTDAQQSETPESNTETVVIPDNQSAGETDAQQNTEVQIDETLYTVTVENGSGSGEYAAGDVVTIEASEKEGQVFAGWISESQSVDFTDASSEMTTFIMPEWDVNVTAEYAAAQYELTVDDGSGSSVTELVAQGDTVTVTAADRTDEGLEFDHWTGTVLIAGVEVVLELEDDGDGSTSFVMPGGPVTVTAVYSEVVTLYRVTVANGTINGTYTELECEEGAQITVTANPSAAGQAFSYWEASEGVELGENAHSSTFTVTVDQNMDFMAVYEGVEYTVTVNSGTANYAKCTMGTVVTVTAAEPEAGMAFDYWYVDSQNVALTNSASSTTTFVMPEGDVTVTAHYRKIQYQLIVENGSSTSQYYTMGEKVTISSNYPASGREFDSWVAVSGNVTFADASRWQTTFTMPAANVVVRATYKDGPSVSENQILELVEGGEYYAGDPIKFTASGGGMTNLTPNPGDYRYRPSSYQIANVTGTWQSSPYSTTMAINAAGDYTLKVIFNKDVFDGSAWVADGTTDTKTVTFKVVTRAEGVATGDTTPVFLVAGVMVVSCIVFIILLVLVLKKRKR